MTDAFTAAYMEACKDRPADHNEIGLWYFRKGWEAGIRQEHQAILAGLADEGAYLGDDWRGGYVQAIKDVAAGIRARSSAPTDTLEK